MAADIFELLHDLELKTPFTELLQYATARSEKECVLPDGDRLNRPALISLYHRVRTNALKMLRRFLRT